MIKSKHPRDFFYIDKDIDYISSNEDQLYDELEYQDFDDIDNYQCQCRNKYSISSIKKRNKRTYQKWNRLKYSMFKKYYKKFSGKNYEDLHSWMSSLFKGKYAVKFDSWYLTKDVYEDGGKIYYKNGIRWCSNCELISGAYLLDGKLQYKNRERYKYKPKKIPCVIKLSDTEDLQFVNDTWFYIKFKTHIQESKVERNKPYKSEEIIFTQYEDWLIDYSHTLSKKELKYYSGLIK